jgi:hypothetical protein
MSDNPATEGEDTLEHIGGSRPDARNNYVGAQAFRALYPYRPRKDQDGKQRDIIIAGLNGIAPRDEMEGMIAAHKCSLSRHRNGMLRGRLEQQTPRASVA